MVPLLNAVGEEERGQDKVTRCSSSVVSDVYAASGRRWWAAGGAAAARGDCRGEGLLVEQQERAGTQVVG